MKSYTIRRVNGNNRPQKAYSIQVRLPFTTNVESPDMVVDETTRTSYQLDKTQYVEGIDRYVAQHELLIKRLGRANGKEFNHYYEPHKFPFYHDHGRSLVYMGARKEVSHSFLQEAALDKKWVKIEVDYSKMYNILPPITGAWFCELKLKNLRSAGLWGNHVDKSDQYKLAAEKGQISVLYITIPWPPGAEEVMVGITREGAVVVSKNLQFTEDELRLVTHVYDTYILPTLVS